MKRIFVVILMLSSASLFAGCNDKAARDYADELVKVLKSYQTEIDKKIEAEKASYDDLASVYAYAKQIEAASSLRTERLRRAFSLTDGLMKGESLTQAKLKQFIADYVKTDFDGMRATYERETDDRVAYLTGLQGLEIQADAIKNLVKALEDLKEDKGGLARLRELGAFASAVKSRLDALECQDLACEIESLKEKKEKAGTDALKNEVQKLIDRIEKQMKDNGCAADVECP